MPRSVVPIASLPRLTSRALSRAMCAGVIRCGLVADLKPLRAHIDSPFSQFIHFTQYDRRIQNDAVANQAKHALVNDSRRDKMQFIGFVTNCYGMTGVIPPL